MEAIKATCKACERVLVLSEVAQLSNGCCPTCGAVLAPGYSHLLVQEARRAQVLQRDLAACLRRLCELRGNLVLDRDRVYEAITAQLPVGQQRAVDAAIAEAESRRLRRAVVREWPRLRSRERARLTPQIVAGLRALAQRVRLMGEMDDAEAARAVLSEAAQTVDAAAHAIRRERLHAELQTASALNAVDAAVGEGAAAAQDDGETRGVAAAG